MSVGYGDVYGKSEWGSVNEANGWGIVYPFNAEGSLVSADSTLYTSDTTEIKADNGTTSGSSIPIGVAYATNYYILNNLFDGSSTTYIDGSFPDTGFATTQVGITQYEGQTYNSVNNLVVRLDQPSLVVGAFLADLNGVFFNSGDTQSIYNGAFSEYATNIFAAIKTSIRSSPYTINETTIIKVEQHNGYVRITEIITP